MPRPNLTDEQRLERLEVEVGLAELKRREKEAKEHAKLRIAIARARDAGIAYLEAFADLKDMYETVEEE